jgi:hypothetical protein
MGFGRGGHDHERSARLASLEVERRDREEQSARLQKCALLFVQQPADCLSRRCRAPSHKRSLSKHLIESTSVCFWDVVTGR